MSDPLERVTGSYKPPDMALGTKVGSFGKAASIQAIYPASKTPVVKDNNVYESKIQ